MPQAQGRGLADVHARGPARQNSAQRIEQVLFALGLQHRFEFGVGVEVILDRPLRTAGDEHQGLGAGRQRLVDGVLDQRLVDDRQHFLRTGLGGRKKARTAPGHGKYDRFNDVLRHVGIMNLVGKPKLRLQSRIG